MSRPAAPAPPERRCAVYTRKSTAAGLEQDFNSLDAQREACEAYVRARRGDGWRLLPERYDDGGFTGATLDRPAFQRLLEDVDAGKVDLVVVYKVDRLSRSLLDFARVMERLGRAGAAFVSVTQNFSTADAMGRLTLNVLMSFAEFERSMIAERTRDKIAASRRRGKWTGGPVPLGYDVAGGKLVVNELEAVVVREAFALYREEKSAFLVARALNARGRRTKGRLGEDDVRRPGPRWTKVAVLRVLKNPLYVGLVPYGRERHPGEHEALVDRETFARTQELLKKPAVRRRQAGRNERYLLAGLVRCGACGGAMAPASTRKAGRAYRYYRCARRDREGPEACGARALPAAALEAFVRARLRECSLAPELFDQALAAFEARLAEASEALGRERAAVAKELARLEADEARLAAELERGGGGDAPAPLVARAGGVREELAACRLRAADVERKVALAAGARGDATWAAGVLAEPDAFWGALSPENERRLLGALLDRIVVDLGGGGIEIVFAFGALVAGTPGAATTAHAAPARGGEAVPRVAEGAA
ncbi:MAG TPA: recombinase family protein [Polyangiaceae bacterium]|nr:recombinase family protein [Polyangiaceae bacterium]